MGFFKKESVIEDKKVEVVNNTNNTVNSNQQITNKNSFRRENLSLFNVSDIKYVIDNFPSMSVEIRNSLNNLTTTLENTIDFIEDRSSEIIKDNRDFKLSQAHRDTSIAIYDVVQNIREYTEWMEDEYEKNLKNLDGDKEESKSEAKKIIDKELIEESNSLEIEIYKDLTLIEPKGFKLEENIVKVDDWDDLLVKTAEILNKQYKNNRNSSKKVENFIVEDKKSQQNSYRDTVIEMLNEYKIGLDEFKVIV